MTTPRIALFLLPLLLAACASQPSKSLRTVSNVDLHRYAGRWYEIARLPNSFQRDDSRATADYTIGQNGDLRVLNTEHRPDGRTKKAAGHATVVPQSGGGRLRVKFTGLAALAPVPREGNYWILALATDYSAALVGTPDRKFLWLLARRADFPAAQRSRYLKIARGEGFAVEKVLIADWPR